MVPGSSLTRALTRSLVCELTELIRKLASSIVPASARIFVSRKSLICALAALICLSRSSRFARSAALRWWEWASAFRRDSSKFASTRLKAADVPESNFASVGVSMGVGASGALSAPDSSCGPRTVSRNSSFLSRLRTCSASNRRFCDARSSARPRYVSDLDRTNDKRVWSSKLAMFPRIC